MIVPTLVVPLLASLVQAAPAQPAPPSLTELRSRLATYERQAEAGRASPAELAALATAVLERVVAAPDVTAQIEACTSAFAPDRDACASRLWGIAKRTTVPLEQRARAAAALARGGDKQAPQFLFELIKNTPSARLADVAAALTALQAERSVPLLASMLSSRDHAGQLAACRVLGDVDSGEARQALSAYLADAPRGTPQWYACTISAAKLGDPAAEQRTHFATHHLEGEDLVRAAGVLLETNQEFAIGVLLQVTRQGRGLAPLEAASRLVPYRPDVATSLMDYTLPSSNPLFRAAALELHRSLRLEPSRAVRALLLDPSPLVQLRAVETVLDWAARQRGRADRQGDGLERHGR